MTDEPETLSINVYKAQGVGDQGVRDRVIKIGCKLGAMPERHHSMPGFAESVFDSNARAIAIALRESLPGGTLDRLIVELLKAKASSLVVPAL